MINAILAGAIPIYAGFRELPYISSFINMERIIYCKFDEDAFRGGGAV